MMGLAYGGLFVLFLAGELGLFDASSAAADTDTTPEDDTPGEDTTTGGNLLDEIPADDLYDAGDFAGEVTGTDGDDSLTGDDDEALAWFLGDGDDSLDASDLNDHAEGGAGNDDLMMRPGDDTALGGDGDDTIDGGTGDDLVYGEVGNDVLTGNMNSDSLYGGDGDDTVLGGSGGDLVVGGDGNDVLSGMVQGQASSASAGFDGPDTLFGGAGDDNLLLGPNDRGTGGTGADLFRIDDTRDDVTGIATITDFVAGEDAIELLYEDRIDPTTNAPFVPEVTVERTEAGAYRVLVGGQAVALVNGDGGVLTQAMVRLVPMRAA